MSQEETVTCRHVEDIDTSTNIGKCRLCDQERWYNPGHIVEIIKRGHVKGILTDIVPARYGYREHRRREKEMGQKTEVSMSDKTSIQVTKETKERLGRLGIKGDTYDAIINRLLDKVGSKKARSG